MNTQSKEFTNFQVDFYKIANYDLSPALRIIISESGKNTNPEQMLSNLLVSANYEKLRDILFSGCNVKGVGIIDNKSKLERFLETFGLSAEFELFGGALNHFLAPHLTKLSEIDNTKMNKDTAQPEGIAVIK